MNLIPGSSFSRPSVLRNVFDTVISGRNGALAIFLILVIAVGPAMADPGNTPWPKFQQNSQNTGQSPFIGPQSNALAWTFETGSNNVRSQPSIGVDGTIYFGGADRNLYALYPNGTRKWSFPTADKIVNTPAIDSDGTIYFGSYDADRHVYALNPDGTQKWSFTAPSGFEWGSAAIGSDGTIYIGDIGGRLHALYPNGTERWAFSCNSVIETTPAIGTDGTVYFGCNNISGKNIFALNPDGSKKWSYNTGAQVNPSISIAEDGTIYAGSNNGILFALNPDGTQKWILGTGGYMQGAPAVGTDGTIYVGSSGTYLYAINPDGTWKWSFPTGNAIYGAAAIGADGTIYFGSTDKSLYALDPDGTEKWKYTTGAAIWGAPCIGPDGSLYIGSYDTKLYAFRDLPPVPDFSATPITGFYPLTVHFSDLSTGTPLPASWAWNFGDGSPNSTVRNPSHTYVTAGNFTVTLTATSSPGSSTIAKSGYINVTTPPTPTIFFEPSSAVTAVNGTQHYGLVVNTLPFGLAGFNLTVTLADPSIGRITHFTPAPWMSINGSSSLPATSLTFNGADLARAVEAGSTNIGIGTIDVEGMSPGTTRFYFAVQNMDADGGAAINPAVSTANLTVYQPLVANFTVTPLTGSAPLLVQFTDLTTGSPSPASWNWTFGDGGTSTVQHPSHSYTAFGSYNVTLTVSNEYCNATVTKNALVRVGHHVETFPGYTLPPTDTDADMLCEDINGNGRLDVDDVVTFYVNMDWVRANTNVGVSPFDFNGNGRIDYDDVVRLYLEVLNG